MAKKYEGTIKRCAPERGFGFVTVSGFDRDTFVHKSHMPENETPENGHTIRFTVVHVNGKPQAREIEILFRPPKERHRPKPSSLNVKSAANSTRTRSRSDQRAGQGSRPARDHDLPAPYTFVPVKIDDKENPKALPVPGHDGSAVINNESEERHSGELRVTLTAHTPLLVGARQFEDELRNHPEFQPTKRGEKRSILEPWRLKDKLGRVVIPGASLKGMIRHYTSALLNAPMEKVDEQEYTYRPNLDNPQGDPVSSEFREAIISNPPDKNGVGMRVRVLGKGRKAIFLREDARALLKVTNGDKIKAEWKFQGLHFQDKVYQYRLTKDSRKTWSVDYDYEVHPYAGGTSGEIDEDQKSVITKQHDSNSKESKVPEIKLYRYVLVPVSELESAAEIDVPKAIIDKYKRTIESLADTNKGHFSSRNPNVSSSEDRCKARESLKGALKLERLAKGALIYLEVSHEKKIQSLGHNFRYRWLYRDTTRYLNVLGGKPSRRPESALTQDEKRWAEAMADREHGSLWVKESGGLTAARALFGYAADENLHGENVFKGSLSRLAGRISINHAVETKDTADQSAGERFLKSGALVALKELGSPKASAVEFYIQQRTKDNAQGRLTTYGDLADDPDSRISGRKFYRHQPPVNENSSIYEAAKEERRNHRALLTRFASNPGSRFEFTVRFQDLSMFEIGALLFVLEIDRADYFLETPGCPLRGQVPRYALKLGYARPLGWGSVTTKVDSLKFHEISLSQDLKSNELKGDKLEDWKTQAIEEFKVYLDEYSPALEQCLDSWSYAGRGEAKYPEKTNFKKNRDGSKTPETTVYNFHTDLRRRHAKARKQNQNAPICETERVGPKFGRKSGK